VPKRYRSKNLANLHEGVAGGHLGQDKTISKVKDFSTGQAIGMTFIIGVKLASIVQPRSLQHSPGEHRLVQVLQAIPLTYLYSVFC